MNTTKIFLNKGLKESNCDTGKIVQKSNNQLKIIGAIFFSLFILLAQYTIINTISIGIVVLLIFAFTKILSTRTIYVNKSLFFLSFFIIFQELILIIFAPSYLDTSIVIKNIIMVFGITVIIFALSDLIEESTFYRAYKFVGIISIVVLYYQSFLVYVMRKTYLPLIILPTSSLENWYLKGERPCSFFSEPQAFASFILPLLVFSFNKREIWLAIIITAATGLSTSTFGIVCCGVVWIMFVFQQMKFRRRAIMRSVSIIVLMIVFYYGFQSLPVFEFARTKIYHINVTDNIRISKGLEKYINLPLKGKLIGIGISNTANYLAHNSLNIKWTYEVSNKQLEYTTTFANMFITGGIGCGLLFILFLSNLFKIIKKELYGIVVIFVLTSFAATIFYNAWFVFYVVIIYSLSNKKKGFKKILI